MASLARARPPLYARARARQASTAHDGTGRRTGVSRARRAPRRRFMPWSLSNKLLLLTLLFVMVAEVLIYIPSIANFRNVWLQEKLDTAALVAMAASAPAALRRCRPTSKRRC